MSELIQVITATDPTLRNQSLDSFCEQASLTKLLAECNALDKFRRTRDNLYERVRALFFLYAIHRFHIPRKSGLGITGLIPFTGYQNLLDRDFEAAIDIFLAIQTQDGPNDGISSALATAYHQLAFQTLADQVRRSVRSVRGNEWMFQTKKAADYPLQIRPELQNRAAPSQLFPILKETTPVRMDLTHSGWSDIFFLGMDFPEGARVLNVSIDLSVRTDDTSSPSPPVEAYLRVIDEPVLRLTSVDLETSADISTVSEVFDFARDYLGLLKAAIIAAGVVPPSLEGSNEPLTVLLARLVGPNHGLEIVSHVNNIPKGSRLAVSTTLLSCLIAACMRATGQTEALTGQLTESERRLVAARAILGEWLGGSGGGWQDSGGVWPGMKLIQGVQASEGDPEFGVSRGRLLPNHQMLTEKDISAETRQKLQDSLVLVHGGMAQDVGPILEMVTEKYLLRSDAEWQGRQQAITILDDIMTHLKDSNVAAIGAATQRNFTGPIQTIIPWASNLYTESLIAQITAEFGDKFWGFWMLGGMSGGGMGFIFDPAYKSAAQVRLQTIMSDTKKRLESAIPFAMEPVVYDFAINEHGTDATLLTDQTLAEDEVNHIALMPSGYYVLVVPPLLRQEFRDLSAHQQAELKRFSVVSRTEPTFGGMINLLFDRLLPQADQLEDGADRLEALLDRYGFDRAEHEQIRTDLQNGRIGLAQNRLPVNSQIKDVHPHDVYDATRELPEHLQALGKKAVQDGLVAVVSLAGGAGSRWTRGAGVVKALNPFCKLGGKHRNFVEIHLAKSRRISNLCGSWLPHVFTTSYLTHEAIEAYLQVEKNYDYPGPLLLSPGRAIGLRLIPMARDLRFAWEEIPQQRLDEQAQKMQESINNALIGWATQMGEGQDYVDNLP
ncbi:MAG: UTP--glucose-1-phosphate uridylyltransferase, partial [Chloroflexota bacterium]